MQRIELTQRIRGNLLTSALVTALAVTASAYAQADDGTAKKPHQAPEPSAQPATDPAPAGASLSTMDRERLMEMQRALAARNLYQGTIDGVDGPKTQAALRNFQTQRGLSVTGELNAPTAEALGLEAERQAVSGTDTVAAPKVQKATQPELENASINVQLSSLNAEQTKEMQQRLQLLGFYRGEVDGVAGAGTRAALQRFFQSQADLAARGVISNSAISLFGTEASDVQPVTGSDAPTKPTP
jgi:peptidoglycan hydrolase-like protein with peptidoglycan-binding domain